MERSPMKHFERKRSACGQGKRGPRRIFQLLTFTIQLLALGMPGWDNHRLVHRSPALSLAQRRQESSNDTRLEMAFSSRASSLWQQGRLPLRNSVL